MPLRETPSRTTSRTCAVLCVTSRAEQRQTRRTRGTGSPSSTRLATPTEGPVRTGSPLTTSITFAPLVLVYPPPPLPSSLRARRTRGTGSPSSRKHATPTEGPVRTGSPLTTSITFAPLVSVYPPPAPLPSSLRACRTRGTGSPSSTKHATPTEGQVAPLP